ncbi:MAG: hypothetical protein R3C56_28475 [Pirellulaceae bacterium]
MGSDGDHQSHRQANQPGQLLADDGVGTACKCDLVYSENNLHIYLGYGTYEGTMAPRKVTGRCVCLLRTEDRSGAAESFEHRWYDGRVLESR